LEGRSLELAEEARRWYAEHGRPWIYAQQSNDLQLLGSRVVVAGVEFSSKLLHEQLAAAEASSVVLLAVSAGPECEELAQGHWSAEKPDEYFFTEIYGSAVVEALVAAANGQICAWADQRQMAALPHYSPGYTGWDVADQGKLWALLNRGVSRPFPGELEVLSTGMLRPKKSLLALVGLTSRLDLARKLRRLIPCENCSLEPCSYRRAAYRNALQDAGDGSESADSEHPGPGLDGQAIPSLQPAVKYSVNLRALRKWSQERLRLECMGDSSIRASFRYDGTTCSNMGRPLAFDYHIRLAPQQEQYRILELSCEPSENNDGFQSMCEYIRDADSLMANIQSEKPLLGRPLAEVLIWQRAASPSGCYCDEGMRMHKWGLVFEVLHFALAQNEAASATGPRSMVQT
jgi:hypothetical protein